METKKSKKGYECKVFVWFNVYKSFCFNSYFLVLDVTCCNNFVPINFCQAAACILVFFCFFLLIQAKQRKKPFKLIELLRVKYLFSLISLILVGHLGVLSRNIFVNIVIKCYKKRPTHTHPQTHTCIEMNK